jgi:hypothetical protein
MERYGYRVIVDLGRIHLRASPVLVPTSYAIQGEGMLVQGMASASQSLWPVSPILRTIARNSVRICGHGAQEQRSGYPEHCNSIFRWERAARHSTFPSKKDCDDLSSKGVGRDGVGMKTQRISIFGIRAPGYATSVATAPAMDRRIPRQSLGRSRKLLKGFHRGALRLEQSGLEHTSE